MLELQSVEMALVFWLCLAASAGCVLYGIKNWHNSGKPERAPVQKDGNG